MRSKSRRINAEAQFESSVRAWRHVQRKKSMKKVKSEADDWLRPEYKRSDLGSIVRGKYSQRMASESNVVVIDPAVSKAFPNEASVNAALRALLDLAKSRVSLTGSGLTFDSPARRNNQRALRRMNKN